MSALLTPWPVLSSLSLAARFLTMVLMYSFFFFPSVFVDPLEDFTPQLLYWSYQVDPSSLTTS
ncbi:hypothetical protein BJ742DRAFT_771184 [Cladochytrium replicatum]|nr:hypothetical protein BJ742DRAFT_771184 [Cladochytrium replicatum]